MAETMIRGRVRVEHGRKRVRAYLGGELAADTTSPLLVWEVPYYPAYYIPADDIRADLVPTGHSPSRGDAEIFDLRMPTRTAPSAARRYAGSPIEELRHAVRLDWDAMDEWLEEDEPVYTHPRDPYTRVDILASSRHVRVEVDSVTVANSGQPRILFEPAFRRATTSHSPTSGWTCSSLRPRSRTAHTRARPATGPWIPAPQSTRTSSGSTGLHWQKARRSPDSPAYTTRRSTSTSAGSSSSDRTQNSADSGPART